VSRIPRAYRTGRGSAFQGRVEDLVASSNGPSMSGQVDLILTSPPFPLRAKKAYGNLQGEEYVDWLSDAMASVVNLLAPKGSLVVEIGNSWDPGVPAMSLLPLRSMLAIAEKTGFVVCQQFVCHNPARLPGPAQWVTVNRLRAKDSFTHVWWFAKDPWVKADNRRVLIPYSAGMKRLLDKGKYNAGIRPSEHRINETSFLSDQGGAIPSNVLSFANTSDDRVYTDWTRYLGQKPHPARMPRGLVKFFIEFLTEPGDLILDCFGGSMTTGAVAESLDRNWISCEPREDYLIGSLGRFAAAKGLQSRAEPFASAIADLREFTRN